MPDTVITPRIVKNILPFPLRTLLAAKGIARSAEDASKLDFSFLERIYTAAPIVTANNPKRIKEMIAFATVGVYVFIKTSRI